VGLLVTDEGRSGSVLETGEDGTATRFIAAGLYEVDVFRAAKGFYVKSIRSGEREVLVDGLEALPSGSVRLDVVLAGDPGRVQGSIGEAVAGATVVLIPETRGRIDRYQTAITDQYGRFTFAEVPPGTYKAFAWEDVKEGDWFDADVLKRYESQAVELKLDPRATKSLDLKIARDK
jgi:hypothetical protein